MRALTPLGTNVTLHLPAAGAPRASMATLDPALEARLNALSCLIGRTPMLVIRCRVGKTEARVYAKAEFLNLTGSIKDRMAHRILAGAYARADLWPGQPIVEATSGNAGIALAALGSALGHPVTIFMPDWMSAERRALLAGYGAEIRLVSREEGGFLGAIAQAEAHARRTGAFESRQFSNPDNWRAHFSGTAPEVLAQMGGDGGPPDAFVAGVGTGGTVMGVSRYFATQGFECAVHPVEPAESPTLSTGRKVGRHRIQGVSDEFVPDIVKLGELAPVLAVPDGDAILMAQKLAKELGLGVGISSGANMVAALQAGMSLGWANPRIATVFCDNSARYLTTDLPREEPVRDHYLTPRVEILELKAI
ncbi:PLP-dependent cysteine synthase family protein [Phenylobacterium sp.]|uniref:PLP-dependent cysteine synthase family protein n=1 Tax=Phenylobacterium sp. TaxID=1871053 RepID=UPI003952B97D